jgi:hypothetical protein
VLAWQAALMDQPLKLGTGPLFVVDALPCGPAHVEVLFRAHHLLLDHVGLLLAINGWAEMYRLLRRQGGLAGTGGARSGSSFTATLEADRHYEHSPQAQQDLAHWRGASTPAPPLLEPRPAPPCRTSLSTEPAAPAPGRRGLCRLGGGLPACGRDAAARDDGRVAMALGTHFDRRDVTLGIALHRRRPPHAARAGHFAAAMPARCRWTARRHRARGRESHLPPWRWTRTTGTSARRWTPGAGDRAGRAGPAAAVRRQPVVHALHGPVLSGSVRGPGRQPARGAAGGHRAAAVPGQRTRA